MVDCQREGYLGEGDPRLPKLHWVHEWNLGANL